MSKKHFECIARRIREQRGTCDDPLTSADAIRALDALARSLCEDFASYNPNFDRSRFLTACGVQSSDPGCDVCGLGTDDGHTHDEA